MDQDATWYEVGLGPVDIGLDGAQLPPQKKGGTASNFRPISIAAKRSPISATAEHLFNFAVCRGAALRASTCYTSTTLTFIQRMILFLLSGGMGCGLSPTHHVSSLSITSPLHYCLLSATQQGYHKCLVLFVIEFALHCKNVN